MIQVQIASQITQHGVDGIRWVLVEDAHAKPDAAMQPAAELGAAAHADAGLKPGAGDRAMLSLVALKSLVIVAGMGAAFWCAQLWLGPPWPDSKAATGVSLGDQPGAVVPNQKSPAVRPSGVPRSQGDQSKPVPVAPAASGSLVVTAGWK